MRHNLNILLSVLLCWGMLSACGGQDIATAVDGSEGPLVIWPDYKEVTIPANIAPLNFRYAMHGVRKAKTTFTLGDRSVTIRGTEVEWRLGRWKAFLEGAAGKTISVKAEAVVDGKPVTDAWTIDVSEDPIDGWLTYRLIEPSYQMYNEVYIRERCIENFDETILCDHKHTDNACMNCHVHGQQRGDYSLYYIRGPKGGAILNQDGKLRKLTLKTPGMVSPTVYGELHPGGRFGVFSTNIILPSFHMVAGQRMEVFDTASDLTVADFENDKMINVPYVARADKWETFPCFSADGHSVFYCVADTLPIPREIAKVRYDLVRADFDAASGLIGEQADLVWSGNGSVCHPKASPDGRWLMFTVADYGTFPLFHPETTLYLADLSSGAVRPLDEIKGDKSDSYHSWSSNSRWFVFASKRGDGQYGKPFFCHLDADGKTTKPFVLPQKSSRFYVYNLKSFNVPDMGSASTGMTARDAQRMFGMDSEAFEETLF